jgi:integrase
LTPWVTAAGAEPFLRLSRSRLQGIADDWRTAGLSANRASKRISALRVAWDTVAPDHALPHAIERVKRYGEPPVVTRGQPMDLIARVLEAVQDDRDTKSGKAASKSKARLRVLAWTGQPPARVMAIKPEHVRWTTKPPQLYVSPRRKGTGSADAWIPLLPQAVAALKAFFAAGAAGTFQTSALARTFKRAVRKAQAVLVKQGRQDDAARLKGLRVYDLRHSLLSSLADESEDIYAVAEYAGHANLQTTRRYMRAASVRRMTDGIAKLTKALKVPKTRAKKRAR